MIAPRNWARNLLDARQRPETILLVLSLLMPFAFGTWRVLLNNFAVEEAGFTGVDIGVLQSLREVPGFLAFAVVFFLIFIREQNLLLFSMALLGLGTALTGFFPSVVGVCVTAIVMSLGHHYFATLRQSLALQWVDKADTAYFLGKIFAVQSFASLITFGLIYLAIDVVELEMKWIYLLGGGVTIVGVVAVALAFPRFPARVEQRKSLILRRSYWLFYALTFVTGARSQVFVVFAAFMMVEKLGFSVSSMTLLFLMNGAMNMVSAPIVGRLIGVWGERRALTVGYLGLVAVFLGYAWVDTAWLAVVLFLLNHIFIRTGVAVRSYFQKIADPADVAASSGVDFTVNHIAALIIPVSFGLLWVISPAAVFLAGAAMAVVSLGFARLIPTKPGPDGVSTLTCLRAKPGGAE